MHAVAVGIFSLALSLAVPASAAKKTKLAPRKAVRAAPVRPAPERRLTEAPSTPAPASNNTARHTLERPGTFRRQFLSGFGTLTLDVPTVALDSQLRFLVSDRWPLYVGGDVLIALPTYGHFLSANAGVWYDFLLAAEPAATLSVGVLGGPAFVRRIPGYPDSSITAFVDASIGFEIDELASVRGQVRPGIVGGRFAFSVAALIGFRFR
ncbi:hypothetical protein K2X33_16385 [bacterium]|nr:hypothetical protein [bacterium]